MNCCSKRCINLVTLIIAIIIFIQTNFLTIMIFNLKSDILQKNSIATEEIKAYKETEDIVAKQEETEEWKLTIPKINVSAQILDGTSGEVINNNIGHFTETPYLEGNIGLIAGSNGYKENYFQDLEKLSKDDVIIYQKGDDKKQYKVTENVIIEQTDWSYLSSTPDNRMTLITGVPEQPEKRRCVQAIEIL